MWIWILLFAPAVFCSFDPYTREHHAYYNGILQGELDRVLDSCDLLRVSDHPRLRLRIPEVIARYASSSEAKDYLPEVINVLTARIRGFQKDRGYCFIIIMMIEAYLEGRPYDDPWRLKLSHYGKNTPLLNELWVVSSLVFEIEGAEAQFEELMSNVAPTVGVQLTKKSNRIISSLGGTYLVDEDPDLTWKQIPKKLGIHRTVVLNMVSLPGKPIFKEIPTRQPRKHTRRREILEGPLYI